MGRTEELGVCELVTESVGESEPQALGVEVRLTEVQPEELGERLGDRERVTLIEKEGECEDERVTLALRDCVRECVLEREPVRLMEGQGESVGVMVALRHCVDVELWLGKGLTEGEAEEERLNVGEAEREGLRVWEVERVNVVDAVVDTEKVREEVRVWEKVDVGEGAAVREIGPKAQLMVTGTAAAYT